MNLNGIPIHENRSLRYDEMKPIFKSTGKSRKSGPHTVEFDISVVRIEVGELAHLRYRLTLRDRRVGMRAWLHAHVAAVELRLYGSLEENA